MSIKLTEEQTRVIHHPLGKHARVLAVAGSGKTTTMVYRIQYLINEKGISPNDFCILMFNRRAREDFQKKLEKVLRDSEKPRVYTFHSYAYSLIGQAISQGQFPPISDFWVDGRQARYLDFIHKAIHNLEIQYVIPPDSFDPDEVKNCIGLWKGSLIPPKCAGHKSKPEIEKIYAEFERLRILGNAASYDDFVPLAVGILKTEKDIREQENRYKILIVDEYQDINYGQHRLIELLAGDRADIMLVGDDDQTIYEWRGARPDYILDLYKQTFKTKPFIDYTLSHSFRFGPILAQYAENVISLNKKRAKKSVLSYHHNQASDINLVSEIGDKSTDSNQGLATQIPHLVRESGDPTNVIVLARTYSQLSGLEIEFLNSRIPYRVIGREPFFKRREIGALLDYLVVAIRLREPLVDDDIIKIHSILNIPNRKLPKIPIRKVLESLARQGTSACEAFSYLENNLKSPLSHSQIEKIQGLFSVLKKLNKLIHSDNAPTAAELFEIVINWTDYYSHFDNYYGVGEASEDRKRVIRKFLEYANLFNLRAKEFLTHISRLDSTRGIPEDQQIVLTTVHKVKGEEYDYVIIPDCHQGNMPCNLTVSNPIYDRSGSVTDLQISDPIENERRLFYVAITRAKKCALIGISGLIPHSQFIDEMKLRPTHETFTEFQHLIVDDRRDQSNLEKIIIKNAGHKSIVNNLLLHYLPKQNISLSNDTLIKIESTPAILPDPSKPFFTKTKNPDEPEIKWWLEK